MIIANTAMLMSETRVPASGMFLRFNMKFIITLIFDWYYQYLNHVLKFTGQLNDTKDENLYSGFGTEEVAPALQTEDLEYDEGFQVGYKAIIEP